MIFTLADIAGEIQSIVFIPIDNIVFHETKSLKI